MHLDSPQDWNSTLKLIEASKKLKDDMKTMYDGSKTPALVSPAQWKLLETAEECLSHLQAVLSILQPSNSLGAQVVPLTEIYRTRLHSSVQSRIGELNSCIVLRKPNAPPSSGDDD